MTAIRRFGLAAARTPWEAEKPAPPAFNEAVLDYAEGNETLVSIERFPSAVTPPTGITIVRRFTESIEAIRFDLEPERDERGRLEYIGRPATRHPVTWKAISCCDCKQLPERLYKRFGLWRCRACWLKAAGAAVLTPLKSES